MKCPHCGVEVHEDFAHTFLGRQTPGRQGLCGEEQGVPMFWRADHMACPACRRAIIRLAKLTAGRETLEEQGSTLAYPRSAARSKAPQEVPPHLAEDYNEAAIVLDDSAKASAALSRRCLQSLLRDQGYVQHDLAKQIDAVLAANTLPSGLAANLDAIRNIGNFAAHPQKDTNSGAIVPVEPHEAEWNLEVLEDMFEHYHVQPARDASRRAALNAKLQQVGKPLMKP